MKIAIIGAGASGLYSALLIKEKVPEAEIFLIEKEAKAGRKILATGNGRCNILNKNIEKSSFKNIDKFLDENNVYNFNELKNIFDRWGLHISLIDNYAYPASFSAASVNHFLTQKCLNNGIKIYLNTTLYEYAQKNGKFLLNSNNQEVDSVKFDFLIMTGGGKSQKKLGSDGSIANILSIHGYKVNEFKPGLCPIKVKEIAGFAHLNGLRHKALVSISTEYSNFSEEGEVLFRSDGLSGIVIFNAESFITRNNLSNILIKLDLFPDLSIDELSNLFLNDFENNSFLFLNGWLEQGFIDYILRILNIESQKKINKDDVVKIAKKIKNITFTFSGSYGFDQSQVSIGGVDISDLTNFLESKKEKNLFVAGELVDVDGYCGGYNLSWCLISALIISEKISKIIHQ